MALTTMLMLLVFGSGPDADPAELVTQLGAARYADREAAAKALARMGARALPALREAAESKDPEVRTRASALLEQIDTDLLTEPTLVTLDFEDKPLDEVASAFSERTGMYLQLQPENHSIWKTKRVTLKSSDPVPFWQAIDLLCKEGGLSYGLAVSAGIAPRHPGLRLTPGGGAFPPHSDHGPFRTLLVSVHHHRDLPLGQSPLGLTTIPVPPAPRRPGVDIIAPVPAVQGPTESFYLMAHFLAEPRLGLPHAEAVKLTEAKDDQGQSMLPDPRSNGRAIRMIHQGGAGAFFQVDLRLKYPEHPGKVIKTLKGSLPVMVTTRKPAPLVVRLDDPDAVGKTVKAHDVSLRLDEFKNNDGGGRKQITITLRNLGPPPEPAFFPAGPVAKGLVPPLRTVRLPLFNQTQFEIVDAAGKPVQVFVSGYSNTRGDLEESRVTLNMIDGPQREAPAELRYYVLTQTQTEIPFEFSEIPMP